MGTITVGVDRSAGAMAALQWAAREARLRDCSVTAVLAWGFFDQQHSRVDERFDPSYGEKDALAALDEIVREVAGPEPTVPIARHVVCDLAASALVGASTGSELLVVGARGLGGFRGLLLGSVSQQCLHHATCPVAIVREIASSGSDMERIVVGIDGSSTASAALGWALDEGRRRQAAVEVVHAWQPPFVGAYAYGVPVVDPQLFSQAAQDTLDQAVDAQDTSGLPIPVERIVSLGGAAGVIIDAAKEADLVVMGSRGLGGFSGLLLGSVSHQVTHHAPCPVVVIPADPSAR